MRMHGMDINNITCCYINYTNHVNQQKRVAYTGNISWWTDISYLKKNRNIETMNINMWFIFACWLITSSRGWQLNKMMTNIISQSDYFQHWSCCRYKFQKTWSTSFHSHINLAWYCNLRFDYSRTFGGFAWLNVA